MLGENLTPIIPQSLGLIHCFKYRKGCSIPFSKKKIFMHCIDFLCHLSKGQPKKKISMFLFLRNI